MKKTSPNLASNVTLSQDESSVEFAVQADESYKMGGAALARQNRALKEEKALLTTLLEGIWSEIELLKTPANQNQPAASELKLQFKQAIKAKIQAIKPNLVQNQSDVYDFLMENVFSTDQIQSLIAKLQQPDADISLLKTEFKTLIRETFESKFAMVQQQAEERCESSSTQAPALQTVQNGICNQTEIEQERDQAIQRREQALQDKGICERERGACKASLAQAPTEQTVQDLRVAKDRIQGERDQALRASNACRLTMQMSTQTPTPQLQQQRQLEACQATASNKAVELGKYQNAFNITLTALEGIVGSAESDRLRMNIWRVEQNIGDQEDLTNTLKRLLQPPVKKNTLPNCNEKLGEINRLIDECHRNQEKKLNKLGSKLHKCPSLIEPGEFSNKSPIWHVLGLIHKKQGRHDECQEKMLVSLIDHGANFPKPSEDYLSQESEAHQNFNPIEIIAEVASHQNRLDILVKLFQDNFHNVSEKSDHNYMLFELFNHLLEYMKSHRSVSTPQAIRGKRDITFEQNCANLINIVNQHVNATLTSDVYVMALKEHIKVAREEGSQDQHWLNVLNQFNQVVCNKTTPEMCQLFRGLSYETLLSSTLPSTLVSICPTTQADLITQIDYAVEAGNISFFQQAFSNGCLAINQRYAGKSLLERAAEKDQLRLMLFLFSLGADNRPTEETENPAMLYTFIGDNKEKHERLQMVFATGVDTNPRTEPATPLKKVLEEKDCNAIRPFFIRTPVGKAFRGDTNFSHKLQDCLKDPIFTLSRKKRNAVRYKSRQPLYEAIDVPDTVWHSPFLMELNTTNRITATPHLTAATPLLGTGNSGAIAFAFNPLLISVAFVGAFLFKQFQTALLLTTPTVAQADEHTSTPVDQAATARGPVRSAFWRLIPRALNAVYETICRPGGFKSG